MPPLMFGPIAIVLASVHSIFPVLVLLFVVVVVLVLLGIPLVLVLQNAIRSSVLSPAATPVETAFAVRRVFQQKCRIPVLQIQI